MKLERRAGAGRGRRRVLGRRGRSLKGRRSGGRGGGEEVAGKIVVKRKKSGTSAVSVVSGPLGDWHSA